MEVRCLPLLTAPRPPQTMGFSIGGWHPFAGGIKGILEGGTIDGHGVFSGGLAGTLEHLDAMTKGIDLSLLGPDVGGALNKLVDALDRPGINAAKWADAHVKVLTTIVAVVGVVFGGVLLAEYAYAAWAAEAGEAAVAAAATEAATLAAADASAGLLAADAVALDAASLTAADASAGLLAADAGAGLDAASLAAADASAGLDATLTGTATAGTTAATGATTTTAGGSLLTAAENKFVSAVASKVGAAAGAALVRAVVKPGVPSPLIVAPSSSLASLTADLPPWWPLAAGGAFLLLVTR